MVCVRGSRRKSFNDSTYACPFEYVCMCKLANVYTFFCFFTNKHCIEERRLCRYLAHLCSVHTYNPLWPLRGYNLY